VHFKDELIWRRVITDYSSRYVISRPLFSLLPVIGGGPGGENRNRKRRPGSGGGQLSRDCAASVAGPLPVVQKLLASANL
jgi:hypothetical protein